MVETEGLGRLINSRRIELNMSQVDVAKKIGVSRQYVSLIEKGKVSLVDSNEVVKKLANVLQLEVERLKRLRKKRKNLKVKSTDPLCKFLYERRLELGLPRKDLNRLLGHKEKSNLIFGLESGEWRPGIKLISRLEKVLSCKIPDELILQRVPNGGSDLGRFLITRRLILRLNQGRVADLAQISNSMMSMIERGICLPRKRTLTKILKVLKCELPAELAKKYDVPSDEKPESSLHCDSGSLFPFLTFG